ncbi:MAG: superoxide dismutase family protein [Gemmatimonadota bacterium]
MRRAAILLVLAACGGQSNEPAPGARADFINASGQQIGSATLHQGADGVVIRTRVDEVPAGEHGFHIHQVGRCEPPFQTAGGHFNPAGREHGSLNPEGPHAGDLANLPADASGKLIETIARGVLLENLFDSDGSALVVHANPDDYRADPAGNAGARIACGVIRRP